MTAESLERVFPKLKSTRYEISSPRDGRYNCAAWAAGEARKKWWPAKGGFWPRGAPREPTVEAFIVAYGKIGYEVCATPDLETGYEKIAVYCDPDGEPSHVARQLASGRWISKLGNAEDITHDKLEGLEGEAYGRPRCFMKRRIVTG